MANFGANSLVNLTKSDLAGITAVINTSFKKGRDFSEGIFYTTSTDKYVSKLQEIGTQGSGFRKRADGQSSKQFNIAEGYGNFFTQMEFDDELTVGEFFKRFDESGASKRGAKKIGNNARRFRQRHMFSHVKYAFSDTNAWMSGVKETTVSGLGPDGKRFASVVHRCSPNTTTTYSNTLAGNNSVGEEALKLHLQNLYDQRDEEGEKLYYGSDDTDGIIWGVSPLDLDEALRVIGSEKRSGTADNDMNVYKGKFRGSDIEVREIPWLTDDDAVYTHLNFCVARTSTDDEVRVMLSNEELEIDNYYTPENKSDHVRGTIVTDSGWVSGRGISFSTGTDSATPYTA